VTFFKASVCSVGIAVLPPLFRKGARDYLLDIQFTLFITKRDCDFAAVDAADRSRAELSMVHELAEVEEDGKARKPTDW
jgi:hypothetical protein